MSFASMPRYWIGAAITFVPAEALVSSTSIVPW
jgi:hypothetical protein